ARRAGVQGGRRSARGGTRAAPARTGALGAGVSRALRRPGLELFPACPPPEATAIAQRACEKYSRRGGRASAAKALDAEAITLAVRAHIRHTHTGYEELLAGGPEPSEARGAVAGSIERRLNEWQRAAPEK